jgi:hypothetical protein
MRDRQTETSGGDALLLIVWFCFLFATRWFLFALFNEVKRFDRYQTNDDGRWTTTNLHTKKGILVVFWALSEWNVSNCYVTVQYCSRPEIERKQSTVQAINAMKVRWGKMNVCFSINCKFAFSSLLSQLYCTAVALGNTYYEKKRSVCSVLLNILRTTKRNETKLKRSSVTCITVDGKIRKDSRVRVLEDLLLGPDEVWINSLHL